MAAAHSHWSRGGARFNYRGTYSATYTSAREQRGNCSRGGAAVEPRWRTGAAKETDPYFPLEVFGGTAEAQRPLRVYESTADGVELLELNLRMKEIQLRDMIQETQRRPDRFQRQIFCVRIGDQGKKPKT